jgi:hypothetical protein
MGKSPCRWVNIPLDSRPLYQDRKVKMDTNIPLNLTKKSEREGEGRKCGAPYSDVCPHCSNLSLIS